MKSICRCYTAVLPQILSARISVSHGWMQDPFILNLKSTDDNGGMKEDPVEIKASRKIQINFHLMQLDTFWCTQLNAQQKQLWKCFCHLQQTTYVKAVSQLSYTSNVRPGIFQNPMKNMRVAISNKERSSLQHDHWKKTIKEPLIMFDCLCTIIIYCKLIVFLFRCNEIVLVQYQLLLDFRQRVRENLTKAQEGTSGLKG